ncbi:hypothetical protein [Paenibacillus humicola]|uniref:hypothetical protein n=1 Tax=Paenibacillus humicola TaxID=3110540 RepID=UPI00237C09FF|nr:hypothetical protein [Paenibacillus humicola]
MGYDNKQLARLNQEAKTTTDAAKRDQLLKEGWGIEQNDLALLPVVHDLNLRVLGSNVKGLVTPASWFCDLTTVWIQH